LTAPRLAGLTGLVNNAELDARMACVQRTWIPQQRLHAGNVAWASARGDGSPAPDATLAWGNPLAGFADVWRSEVAGQPAEAALHLAPDAAPAQRADAVNELLEVAAEVTVGVSRQDRALTDVLARRGFREDEGPWFAQLWRDLTDLFGLAVPDVAGDYVIRPAGNDDLAERVEVHRRCWAPARIKGMLNLPVTGDEPGPVYTPDIHRAVMASSLYCAELDLVAVAGDGSFAAYGLGWLDPGSGSVLLEPVGTDPGHVQRGLARALCAEILRTARDLGATQAIVGPRGDNGYPVPRRVYAGLGMHEVAQFVSMTTGPVEALSGGRGGAGVPEDSG
jgi:GNAT superfamily N-acetyltransferase